MKRLESFVRCSLSVALGVWAAVAFCDDKPENLIVNSDFAKGLEGWGVNAACAKRVETAALSGEWVVRALGKDRMVMTLVGSNVRDWQAGEKYTMVVKARCLGAGSKLVLIHRFERPGGDGIGEGTYRDVGLTPDWHEYTIDFPSNPNVKPWGVTFMKSDTGGADTGLEIASVRLYKGTFSSFEVRKIGRAGRGTPQPGTEVPVAPCLYGTAARPPRVFAVVHDVTYMREVMHVFAGTGAQLDLVGAESVDQDIYTSDGETDAILKRLKAGGAYDVYMIARGVANHVGPELYKCLARDVEAGAGLYLEAVADASLGHFKGLLAGVKDGRFGKGRVTRIAPTKDLLAYPNNHRAFIALPDLDRRDTYGLQDYPDEQVRFAEVCEAAVRTAFGEPTGRPARTDRKTLVCAGVRHTLAWDRDAAGKTLRFTHEAKPVETARLGAFTDDGTHSTIAVEDASGAVKLRWTFSDFSGRVFAEGEVKVKGEGEEKVKVEGEQRNGQTSKPQNLETSKPLSLSLPREKLYTNLGVVSFTLTDADGEILDRRNEAIYVVANDMNRLLDDFGVSIWPPRTALCNCDADDMYAALGRLGVRATIFADGIGASRLGYGVGGGYIIGGEYFSGGPKSKDHVRSPVFNTKEARRRIADKARNWAKANAKRGVYHGAFSDEAQLGPSDEEVDAHPENVAEYRVRMERKYGTIAEYNRRHRTKHASFADVGPVWVGEARAATNAAEWIEWRTFNLDRWVEVIREVGEAAREEFPTLRYSLDNSFGQTAFSGNDYWKLLTKTGLDYSKEYTSATYLGCSSPLENFEEVYRSFRPDMRVWSWTGYGFTRPRERILPWWSALHRYGGFTWFAATYWGINLVDMPSNALTLDAAELGESLADSRLLDGLGRVLTKWSWTKNDIAIYFSHDSALVTTFLGPETGMKEMRTGSPFYDFQTSRLGAKTLVEELLYQHDYVSYEQVGDGKLVKDGYKVLFMPRIVAMTDREIAGVKAFLAKGGKVVADQLPGDYDELGVKRAVNPFAGSGILVTGKNFSPKDAQQRKDMLAFLVAAGATPVLVSPTVVTRPGREAMHYANGAADVFAVERMCDFSHDTDEEEFVFGKTGHVYDVRAQKYLGETDRVKVRVPLNEASVFAVLPARFPKIGIEGPSGPVTRGTDLEVAFRVPADAAYVLHVELVPPSGPQRFHFSRNLDARDGVAHLDFPIALNDETGTWTIRVTEPLTGVTAEKAVKVK